METIIAEAQRLCLFSSLDVQFARMLTTANYHPALMLAYAWISSNTRIGHVCLPLKLLRPQNLFGGIMPSLAQEAWRISGCLSPDSWQKILLDSPAISDGSSQTPIILDKQKLYLQRMWKDECTVARFFNQNKLTINWKEEKIIKILDSLFPCNNKTIIDWQKIAVAVAITHPVTIISGGPGTGKTFTIAKIIATLMHLDNGRRLRVAIAAPTGKAASRLSESLSLSLTVNSLLLDKEQKKHFPLEAVTLHRLLGATPNTQRMRYHQGNLIAVDVLIVDEASMIDLSMMAHIINSIPPETRVIFLGDRFQLSSVEAGAVLGDICKLSESGYSQERRTQLSRLTGFLLPKQINSYSITDNICFLHKNYRFSDSSIIGYLAHSINSGDSNKTLSILKIKSKSDLHYTVLNKEEEYQQLLKDCIYGYRYYLHRLINQDSPASILKAFNEFRLLCALREGPFGVSGLNNQIEQLLKRTGLIVVSNNLSYIYAGRPIMIARNSPSLGLYNGDIGILIMEDKNKIRVFFANNDGSIKIVPLSRLPEHETAFAMTVHKSQGSEFKHVALVLPDQKIPILTRELLYTAVTRARTRLSIYATDEIIKFSVLNRIERRSGLVERLIAN